MHSFSGDAQLFWRLNLKPFLTALHDITSCLASPLQEVQGESGGPGVMDASPCQGNPALPVLVKGIQLFRDPSVTHPVAVSSFHTQCLSDGTVCGWVQLRLSNL